MSNRSLSAAAVLAAVVLSACTGEVKRDNPLPEIAADVAVVERRQIPHLQSYAGTIRAASASTLSSTIQGDVAAVHVTAGDRVSRGQLLVEIAARDITARLERARSGELEAERAIASASAAEAAAEAQAEIAEKTWRRYAALRERKSASIQEYDEAEARHRSAAAQLERARSEREQVLARRSGAAAASAEAAAFARYTQIRAPFGGVISARFVDPGAHAAPGVPLLTIDAAERFRVEVSVDEATNIATGADVVIETGGTSVTGRVTHVVPAVDAASRSALVKIELPAGRWRSGSYARVLVRSRAAETLTIPATAVTRRGGLTSVFVVDDDAIARLRLVTTGAASGDRVEVLSGLESGERVVAGTARNIREGVRISGARS